MSVKGRRYLSFLLRMWLVKNNGEESWRATLDDPHTSERHSFASLYALIKFLLKQTQNAGEEQQNNRILERGKD